MKQKDNLCVLDLFQMQTLLYTSTQMNFEKTIYTYLYEMYMNTVKLNIPNSNVQTKANIAS